MRGKRRVFGAVAAAAMCAGLARGGADREARVDAEGVLRWADGGGEVALLGVNYYTPFTVDYAETKRLGLDQRQVIRDDVAHFRRLGFGCVRVHCFDREFSDAEGNLVDNHHLELLDYLVATCAANGIYSVLTPIAWWGGAFAPGSIHGFSDVHDMRALTADRATWPVQARFLKQFAEHVNRFTLRRYADDPCVLAFECINEPLYPKDTPDAAVTDYINALTDALRAGGTAKPVYYNSWQGRNAAAGASRADGVTCSYYPTGLVAGRELEGPQLARIRASSLRPDAAIARKSRMAYEFDAADVGASYMYPALAKLFRAEGVQVAAQFQYDPLPLADVNRNWQTHHLNLVYTPGKALAMAIAAEVFARVPRGAPYEAAEGEMRFPPFRVSVAEDLSEMVTSNAYLHSNATRTPPPDPAALERVWGRGPSPVVDYRGTGAYFLDRVAAGVWRLQVYPDVFTVADPYTGTRDVKVKVLPTRHPMTVRLPDLGEDFFVFGFETPEEDNRSWPSTSAREGSFAVTPRSYRLVRRVLGKTELLQPPLEGFVAPIPAPDSAGKPLVRVAVPPQWRAGAPLELSAEAALTTNLTAQFRMENGEKGRSVEMSMEAAAQERSPYRFEGTLPGGRLTTGVWGVTFRALSPWREVARMPSGTDVGMSWLRGATAMGAEPVPFLPFPDLRRQEPTATRHGIQTAEMSVMTEPRPAIRSTVGGFGGAGAAAGYTCALPFVRLLDDRGHPRDRWGLRVTARGGAEGARVELGFRMENGQGLGCNLRVGSEWSERVIPAAELIPLWGLPSREAFHWADVTQLSVLTGAWLFGGEEPPEGGQTFDLAGLEWVPLLPAYRINVIGDGDTWSLFDQKAWMRVPVWHAPLQRWELTDDEGRPAVHLGAKEGFDGEHASLSLRARCDGQTFARLWQTEGAGAVLVVRARAARPETTAFELAFVETGGAAWGMDVPLTPQWRTLRIPLNKLRLFTQWDKEMAAKAGPHLRLSQVDAVNVCFGKWLYPQTASARHAFEISEIGIEAPAR